MSILLFFLPFFTYANCDWLDKCGKKLVKFFHISMRKIGKKLPERMNIMYQSNYGYYNPQSQIRQTVVPQLTQPIMQQQPILKGHPVASLEEARATSIDFDGSVFFFPDLANKKIYTKQINADGTASLNMYSKQDLPPETPAGGKNKKGVSIFKILTPFFIRRQKEQIFFLLEKNICLLYYFLLKHYKHHDPKLNVHIHLE